MEVPSEDGEMPVPLNSTYGGHGHMIHHHDPPPPSHNHHLIIPSSAAAAGVISSSSTLDHDEGPTTFKKLIRYRECLKNHAAAMGGNATDGCGEFMPSGDDGTLEALTCSACHCHRNFHRKEIDGEPDPCTTYHVNSRMARKLFVGHHALGYHHHGGGALRAVAPPPPHQMIMSYNIGGGGGSQSDEQEPPPHHQVVKKRFRTKFTAEQKEKMLNFAEKVGWKIQKQEEGVVQSFCQEVGVKRRVLKVWMHNNKHSLAKKNNIHSHDHPQEQHQLV